MIKVRLVLFFAFGALASCTNGVSLQSIDYSGLLSDGNSKVWLIDQEVSNGVNVTESLIYSKRIIIFHNDGTVNIIPMSEIGKLNPVRGHYHMRSDEKNLTIDLPKDRWLLKARYITEDSLYLEATPESDIATDIKIIPFPKL